VFGLFSREVWMRLFENAGFQPRIAADPYDREVFIATKG
jgi:hypothetical protein